MDIGLNGPDDFIELERIINLIRTTYSLYLHLPADAARLGEPGSELNKLVDALPDPPFDPRISLLAGLTAANSCMTQVADLMVDNIPTTPVVLQTLVRTALLGTARIVFSLGPANHDERVINTLIAMRQEAGSLDRLYTVAEGFTSLLALVPPAHILVDQRERINVLKERSKSLGEAA